MLQELDIESYAVADRLRVRFHAGLNLLTGETGSGKSIVVDSLALLFGARADAGVIRAGAKRARISGIFDPPPGDAFRAWLEARGFAADDELIVERQILASSKSRAYVNGSPATLAALKELAARLGDIHGQHEQQMLFSPREQMKMLDGFAGTAAAARGVAEAYRAYRKLEAQIRELKAGEQERLRLLDLLRFQAGEIGRAELQPSEDEALQRERSLLLNLSRLRESCAAAYHALYEADAAAAAQLKAAAGQLEAVGALDESLANFAAGLETARAAVEDTAFEIRNYIDRLEAQPERQEEIEERLALIEKLKRKYGPTLDDVARYGEKVGKELEELEAGEAAPAALEERLREAGEAYRGQAAALGRRRREAAEKLEAGVERELADLAMEKARFAVGFEPLEDWSADGLERIVFLFSANPGQAQRPLHRAASGGELSRVALALKTCLTGAGGGAEAGRTLVFDEVDSGVGGRVAEAVGKRLKKLSAGSQVLCVTHLPQIAGFADAHFHVAKTEERQQTFASVSELSGNRRIEELARMLSGAEVTEAALANARQLAAREST